jgi:hypothetical protein
VILPCGFHAGQNPALLIEQRGPTHGFYELNTNLGAGFSNEFAGHMDAIAAVESDLSGKLLHGSQASVVQETAAALGQVDNWKLQLPLGDTVDIFNDKGRPQEGGIYDSKRCAPVCPLGIGAATGGGLRAYETPPKQIESQDGDQNSANPIGGKKIVGTLTMQFRKVESLNGDGDSQKYNKGGGYDKLLSHSVFSM